MLIYLFICIFLNHSSLAFRTIQRFRSLNIHKDNSELPRQIDSYTESEIDVYDLVIIGKAPDSLYISSEAEKLRGRVALVHSKEQSGKYTLTQYEDINTYF